LRWLSVEAISDLTDGLDVPGFSLVKQSTGNPAQALVIVACLSNLHPQCLCEWLFLAFVGPRSALDACHFQNA
jgi:hypothetical protein